MRRENYFKKFLKIRAARCKELRQMIADIIAPTIEDCRATKENQFFYEFDMPPTDDEVDAFIILGSCFEDEMKKFLLSEVGSLMMGE